MLKLDLTGQSSHVSFSRNILSSSSRALRDCEGEKRNGDVVEKDFEKETKKKKKESTTVH